MEIENDKIRKENERQNSIVNTYNSAVSDYNYAVNDLNAFIDYRNHQFVPEKPDAYVQGMIDMVTKRITSAKTKLNTIANPDANTTLLMAQLTKPITEINSHLTEQQDWLTTYFSKSKSKRKSMFYEKKISWFGIPLN